MVSTIYSTNNVITLTAITLLAAVVMVQAKVSSVRIDESSRAPPCESPVYCYGNLLHTVQMASIFTDSKTFVDMKMMQPENETLASFDQFMKETGEAPTKEQIALWVNNTFEHRGVEFAEYVPTDWIEHPRFLDSIVDPDLNNFAYELNDIWKMLGKKMTDDVRDNEELYSIIYVPNPVIVPGGRFLEFYYWDSYWIIKGLLYSEMYTTVKGMLSNFASIIERIGHIPNGGRLYYKMRSHPPLLIPMVEAYLEYVNDTEWLVENLWLLDKEWDFWMTNNTVTIEKDGVNYTLARYNEVSSGPRPESYREDYEFAETLRTEEEKYDLYRQLKSAAQSGWDFSSRWFILDGTNKGNLSHTKTIDIIPVDLNSILYRNAILLAEFHNKVGNTTKANEYLEIAAKWQKAVTAILWHDEVGAWLDYDMINDVKRDYFYPTNLSPFWTNCYDPASREYHTAKILKYLEKSQIMVNMGGLPATVEHTGEQWDYPNSWAPLNWIVIKALNNTGDPWAQRLALEIAQRWVRNNYLVFNDTTHMYEKYDATVAGGHGGGGEYEVQLGFGWTNGVAMDLMYLYGDKLTARDTYADEDTTSAAFQQQIGVSTTGQLLTGILVLIISLATGFIGIVVYKSRHCAVTSPTTTLGIGSKKSANGSGGIANAYRKRVAYTELKDMNYD